MLKNHKPFFINIGTHRDILVQNRLLFADFWPVKFRPRDRAPPNSVRIKHLLAPTLYPKSCFARQVAFELSAAN